MLDLLHFLIAFLVVMAMVAGIYCVSFGTAHVSQGSSFAVHVFYIWSCLQQAAKQVGRLPDMYAQLLLILLAPASQPLLLSCMQGQLSTMSDAFMTTSRLLLGADDAVFVTRALTKVCTPRARGNPRGLGQGLLGIASRIRA